MNKYEMLYIINNTISEEEKETVMSKVKSIIEVSDGKILSEEKIGTQKLAYLINRQREGYYVLLNFEAASSIPEELNRQIRNMNETYRCMIIKK